MLAGVQKTHKVKLIPKEKAKKSADYNNILSTIKTF